MGAERRGARGVAHDARLDRHQARAAAEQMVRPDSGGTAAAEGRAAGTPEQALPRDTSAGALGGGERLGDERLGPLTARRADAAWPELEVVLLSHRRPRQCAKNRGSAMR